MKTLPGKFEMTAKTLEGLEEVLANELTQIGAEKINKGKRAVTFWGDLKTLYAANYCLRTAINILVPIKTFEVNSEDELYKQVSGINWTQIFSVKETFSINATLSSEIFTHSKYVALKTKDAIADQFRRRKGERPNVETMSPDFKINVRILQNICTISLDSSGDPLFKRGYRKSGHIAPLNEALAAGMILLSGWDKKSDFTDPMCGSGTLLIEAALIAHKIPPGIYRKKFAFENWQNFDADIFNDVCDEYDVKSDFKHNIYGSDISKTAVQFAQENVLSASLKGKIDIEIKSLSEAKPKSNSGVLIMNPPYGERIKPYEINALYQQIGDRFKSEFQGFSCWLISSNFDAIKKIGLHSSKKTKLFNGSLECKFLRYDIYKGSMKQK